MNTLSKKDMEVHVTITGWLQVVNSLLSVAVGAFVATLILGAGAFSASLMQDGGAAREGAYLIRFMGITAAAIGGLMFILSVPGLVAGIGLLRRASWARVMAQVVAVFELVLFPIGTLLGIYTIFILSQRAAADVFGPCCALEESHLQAAAA